MMKQKHLLTTIVAAGAAVFLGDQAGAQISMPNENYVLFELGDGNSGAVLDSSGIFNDEINGNNETFYPTRIGTSPAFDVFSPPVLSDDRGTTGLTMQLSGGSYLLRNGDPTIHYSNEVGLGGSSGSSNAWNWQDSLLFTFNQEVILSRIWINSSINGERSSADALVGGVSIGLKTATTAGGRGELPLESSMTWDSELSSTTIELWHSNPAFSDDVGIAAIAVEVVPEPSSLALLGIGGLLIARRRRG